MSPALWLLRFVLLLTNLCHAENVREFKVQVGQLYLPRSAIVRPRAERGNSTEDTYTYIYTAYTTD